MLKRRFLILLFLLLCFSSARAQTFPQTANFIGSYAFTSGSTRIQLNRVILSMATIQSNAVHLYYADSNTTNLLIATTNAAFQLTSYMPGSNAPPFYMDQGTRLLADATTTNRMFITIDAVIIGGIAGLVHGTTNIIPGSIGSASLGTTSVTAAAIAAGAVTQAKLASNAVNGAANVQDYSLEAEDYKTNSVGAGALANIVTASNCVNCTVWFDADGRATQFQSTASSAIGTQAFASVLSIGNDGGGVGITNVGTSVFQRLSGSMSGTNLDNGSIKAAKIGTNYESFLRMAGFNTSAGSAAGLSAGGARVMMVTTAQAVKSRSYLLYSYLSTSNSGSANFYNEIRLTAQVSSNGTTWMDADNSDASQGAISGNGFSHPGKLVWNVPAGMYYQVFCAALNALTNHLGWTNAFQLNVTEPD